MNQKYSIEVTENQLQVLKDACEVLTRIYLGQLDYAADAADLRTAIFEIEDVEDSINRNYKLRERLKQLNPLITGMPSSNASFGIGHQLAHPNHRISYEMSKVLAKFIALQRNPEGDRYSYVFDDPLKLSDEPLLIITKK